jgi:hypothetical protein
MSVQNITPETDTATNATTSNDEPVPFATFEDFATDAPIDVRLLVAELIRDTEDACPTLDRPARRLGWTDDAVTMAVTFARHLEFVEIWERDGSSPSVILAAWAAARHGFKLQPHDGVKFAKRHAWEPVKARPAKVVLGKEDHVARATDLNRIDPLGTFANLVATPEGHAERSTEHALADDHGLTVCPADAKHDPDRVILSPLPRAAYAVDLAMEYEAGRMTADEFVVLIRPHLQPVGLSHTWAPRNEDRAEGEHQLDPKKDPRLDFTIDSPRFWQFNKNGPQRKKEEFEKAMARELARHAELASCPGCRDRKLGLIEYCSGCSKSGIDHLIRHADANPATPDETGIDRKAGSDEAYVKAFRKLPRGKWSERLIREQRKEYDREAREEKAEESRKVKEAKAEANRKAREEKKQADRKVKEEKKQAKAEAARKIREDKAAVEASRTRPQRGRPAGMGMKGYAITSVVIHGDTRDEPQEKVAP